VSSFTFDYGGGSVKIVSGAPFVADGIRMTVTASEGAVAGIRMRQSKFQGVVHNGPSVSFEFVELHGADYQSNRLTILTQSGPPKTSGFEYQVTAYRLQAIGMCVQTHGQQRS
jgi:hypothetical protein